MLLAEKERSSERDEYDAGFARCGHRCDRAQLYGGEREHVGRRTEKTDRGDDNRVGAKSRDRVPAAEGEWREQNRLDHDCHPEVPDWRQSERADRPAVPDREARDHHPDTETVEDRTERCARRRPRTRRRDHADSRDDDGNTDQGDDGRALTEQDHRPHDRQRRTRATREWIHE